MGRPSFQFYPDDWLTDVGLRTCAPETRAIWIDLICLMHQGEPYGYLTSKTGKLPIKFLAQTCGVSVGKLAVSIGELERNGVFSRDENGAIFSRRMVKDERVRLARSTGGRQSQNNPNVPKRKPKDILQGYPLRMVQASPGHAEDEEEVCSSSSELEVSSAPILILQSLPEWKRDEVFVKFASEYAALGKPFIDEDFDEAYQFEWKHLDWEQKLLRVKALDSRREEYRRDPTYISMPRKFIKQEWKRKPREPPKPAQKSNLGDRTIALWEENLARGESPL